MSLTNPNKVITEERLSEFYQGILPYLGGMPDILANKFSKADLYSTDEKMIGRWIDGKPLYQKSYVTQSAYSLSRSAWTTIGSLSVSNITPVSVDLVYSDSSGAYANTISIYVANSTGDISAVNNNPITTTASLPAGTVITIKYTKTADSPVEIGNDTDYSTTEKIVGTWIDGKPLYQKVIPVRGCPKDMFGIMVDLGVEVDTFVGISAVGNAQDDNYNGGYCMGGTIYARVIKSSGQNTQIQPACTAMALSYVQLLVLYTKV